MSMKKYFTGILYLIGALLIWIGPKTIFQVCEQGEKKMKCFWTTQAEIGLAILLAVAAVLILLAANAQVRKGLYAMVAAINVVGILFPAVLIGGCPNHMMPCQKVTFPALYLIHGILLLVSLVSLLRKEDHGEGQKGRR